MARRTERIDDEQKSYSAVFLLSVGLLLIGAAWALWDDNISRRPWKKYQVDFSELQIQRAQQAVADEDARLAQDPKYQEVSTALAEAERKSRTARPPTSWPRRSARKRRPRCTSTSRIWRCAS
jgi:hypothetical protein